MFLLANIELNFLNLPITFKVTAYKKFPLEDEDDFLNLPSGALEGARILPTFPRAKGAASLWTTLQSISQKPWFCDLRRVWNHVEGMLNTDFWAWSLAFKNQ